MLLPYQLVHIAKSPPGIDMTSVRGFPGPEELQAS